MQDKHIDEDLEEMLGDWGKHLVKEYGLSVKDAMSIELEAAELYAHDTRDGWCCACDADIAFATKYIQDEPEYKALITTEQLAIWNKALELVGEDEEEMIPPNDFERKLTSRPLLLDVPIKRRNELKAELRSAIQQQIDKIGGSK